VRKKQTRKKKKNKNKKKKRNSLEVEAHEDGGAWGEDEEGNHRRKVREAL